MLQQKVPLSKMTATNPFNIRPAGISPSDAAFITSAFDSTLPHLAATGNAGQWGTQPFSEKEVFRLSVFDDLTAAKKYRETGQGEKVRMFLAEVEDGNGDEGFRRVDERGKGMLSVATMTIRDDDFAAHLKDLPELQSTIESAAEEGSFIFIDVLVSDYRTGPRRKGAGLALLNYVKDLAHKEGKRTVFMDCYRGGTGRLIEYYEQQGFRRVGEFEYQQANGTMWPGRLLRLDLR